MRSDRHAARLQELARPVAGMQARDHHVLAGTGSMHELAVAAADAHMVDTAATAESRTADTAEVRCVSAMIWTTGAVDAADALRQPHPAIR